MGGLNEIEKKNIILERINTVYFEFSGIIENKDDLINIIEQSLKEEEKKLLSDKSILQYYMNKINQIWDKIENDRYFYQILLSEHIKGTQNQENVKTEREINSNLENIIQNFNDKIKEIEKKAEDERKKMNDYKEQLEQQFKEKIKKFENDLKNAKDEEEKKNKENLNKKLKRKKEVNKLFEEKLEKIKLQKYSEIEQKFINSEKNFCMEEISKYDKEKITIFIKKFLKNEKIPKFIVNYLIQQINLKKEMIKNVEHLNIILVGPSGVGKSTLINSILGLNIKTGFGRPQTKEIEFFFSENIPFLRLVDSRGIEKNIDAGITTTTNKIKDFIKKQIEDKNYNNFIHIIWYCWTGTRLEESEVNLLKELSQQYSLETLPVIIVYTNAVFKEEVENAKKYIKEDLKLENEFIDVLAKEKKINTKDNKEEIIEAKNLDKLREKSVELAKSAVKSSIFEGVREEIRAKIQENINILISELKKKIDIEIKKYIEKMDENTKIVDLYKEMKNVILNVLYKYFLLNFNNDINFEETPQIKCGDIEFSFSQQSLDILDDFIIEYFKEVLCIYQNNLENFLTKYSKKLANDISIYQIQFNTKNNSLLDNIFNNIDLELILRNELKEKLNKKAELAALKNSFQFIVEPLIEKIGEYFTELYKQGMNQKKFIEYATGIIKVSFDEIEKKIKEYNEGLKEKKEKEENKDNKESAPISLKLSTPSEVRQLFEDESIYK